MLITTERLTQLCAEVTACRRCPRLVEHREAVAQTKKPRYKDWEY